MLSESGCVSFSASCGNGSNGARDVRPKETSRFERGAWRATRGLAAGGGFKGLPVRLTIQNTNLTLEESVPVWVLH